MDLDPDVVASLIAAYQPTTYLRVTPTAYRATPLGMGFGKIRFASPTDVFNLLYIAEDLATSVAEVIIRDRFEGASARELTVGELAGWGVAEVSARVPLRLLDIRTAGCFLLGVSTDITGAKAQDEGRQFSQAVFDQTDLDGILYSRASHGERASQCMSGQWHRSWAGRILCSRRRPSRPFAIPSARSARRRRGHLTPQ